MVPVKLREKNYLGVVFVSFEPNRRSGNKAGDAREHGAKRRIKIRSGEGGGKDKGHLILVPSFCFPCSLFFCLILYWWRRGRGGRAGELLLANLEVFCFSPTASAESLPYSPTPSTSSQEHAYHPGELRTLKFKSNRNKDNPAPYRLNVALMAKQHILNKNQRCDLK